MQNLISIVLAAVVSALIVAGAYHAVVVAPRLRRLNALLNAYDALLGGGASATERLAAIERAVGDAMKGRAEFLGRIDQLEKIARTQIPRIGFVRYNAFPDVGSDLSYALALLNAEGDGVVLSSIYSREETRTFGKAVARFKTAQDPSDEELAAIAKVRGAAS
jgi:hypothetical protein